MLLKLRFVGFVLIVVFGFYHSVPGQELTEDNSLANKEFEDVHLDGKTVESLLSGLSAYYDIPIGLELPAVYDLHVFDGDLERLPLDFREDKSSADFNFKKGTLTDLINQIVSLNKQYTWEIKDGVVNVFPQKSYRYLAFEKLLNTKIKTFSIEKNSSCHRLGIHLANTPEFSKFLKTKKLAFREQDISGFYIMQLGREFSFDVSNLTLKSILNKVIKESPTAKLWILERELYDKRVINLTFIARYEDSSIKNGKLVFPK